MAFIGRLIWLIISLSAIAAAMLFATSNTGTVSLELWPFSGSLNLAKWMVVLGSLGIGALVGGAVVWLSLVAARTRNWRLQRQLGKAEARIRTAEEALAAARDSSETLTPPKPTSHSGPMLPK